MGTAVPLGMVGSSALVVGPLLGAVWTAPKRVTGVLVAFAGGTLISAHAFELLPEAVEIGGLTASMIGSFAGSIVFVVDTIVDSRGAEGVDDPDDVLVLDGEIAEVTSGAAADQGEKLEHGARADAHRVDRSGSVRSSVTTTSCPGAYPSRSPRSRS